MATTLPNTEFVFHLSVGNDGDPLKTSSRLARTGYEKSACVLLSQVLVLAGPIVIARSVRFSPASTRRDAGSKDQ
jgi:hypothetical protein